jgi:hypothetical protein
LIGSWPNFSDDTWLYDLSANTWTQQSPSSKPSARVWPAMAPIGGYQVLLFGGYDSGTYDDETWLFDSGQLAVELADLQATRGWNGVTLEWRTLTEIKHAGFRVLREETSGELTNLTPRLITPRSRGGELGGASYRYLDRSAPSDSVHYWLEDVDTLGRTTRHGPVVAPPAPVPALGIPQRPGEGLH